LLVSWGFDDVDAEKNYAWRRIPIVPDEENIFIISNMSRKAQLGASGGAIAGTIEIIALISPPPAHWCRSRMFIVKLQKSQEFG